MQLSITSFFKQDNNNIINSSINNNNNISEINIYTDGACSHNGTKNAKAGIGIYISDNVNISERLEGLQTNQRAELYAILKALQVINISDYSKINIYTDSMYSINCVTKWIKLWLKNGWLDKKKKPIKNRDLISKIYNIISKQTCIYFIHIAAHTNKKDIHSIGNSIADKLARQSIN